jgi:predicted type IV restriction endonuclease
MDDHPFLEIDMHDLKEPLIDELKKITKSSFNLEEMVSAATELKYVGGIVQILTEQLSSPSEDFTKVFFAQLCPGRVFAPNAKTQFASYTQRALNQFVRDRLNILLGDSPLQSHPVDPAKDVEHEVESSDTGIVTTSESRISPIAAFRRNTNIPGM